MKKNAMIEVKFSIEYDKKEEHQNLKTNYSQL